MQNHSKHYSQSIPLILLICLEENTGYTKEWELRTSELELSPVAGSAGTTPWALGPLRPFELQWQCHGVCLPSGECYTPRDEHTTQQSILDGLGRCSTQQVVRFTVVAYSSERIQCKNQQTQKAQGGKVQRKPRPSKAQLLEAGEPSRFSHFKGLQAKTGVQNCQVS